MTAKILSGTVPGKGGEFMYIHGLIDGALIVIVLEVITMIALAMIYSKKK